MDNKRGGGGRGLVSGVGGGGGGSKAEKCLPEPNYSKHTITPLHLGLHFNTFITING